MDAISLSIELGKAIQKDEIYVNYKLASQKNDEDKDLQNLIGEFNLKKLSINNEISKDEKDDSKIKILNDELKDIYIKIIENENMRNYQEKKNKFDSFINKINKIISASALGQDPMEINLEENETSCSGNCGSCGGCH